MPVPAGPFPRVNDTAEFRRRVTMQTIVCWILLLAPFAVIAALLRWLF